MFYTFVVIGFIVLFYLMTKTHMEFQRAVHRVEGTQLVNLKMSLWGLLFGILIEWKALKDILAGKISINLLIIPALIIGFISFIPRLYWVEWLNLDTPFYESMLRIPEIQMLLNVFTGVLLMRAFTK